MRVLVALPQPPLPEGTASGRCAVGLLRGLRAHGVDLHALAARQHFSATDEPPDDLGVEVVEVAPEPPGLRTRVVVYRHPLGELARSPFADRLRERARDADLLHLEEVQAGCLAGATRLPTAVHLHYLARLDRPRGAPWTRSFREVALFSRAERAAVSAATHVVASSPVVADALRSAAPGVHVTLAPITVDGSLYPRAPLDGPPLAGLLGTAAWPPTANAVVRLLREVWPLVRRERPEARLLLAGRGMAALVPPSSAAGVEVVGDVASASSFLRRLSLLLYPLGRGSGMKVKVLESIASGLPVVTTPPGAEGFDGADGIAVETEDARLAAAATELLGDARARRERGAAARAAFERRYAPRPATEPLVALYERLAEGSG